MVQSFLMDSFPLVFLCRSFVRAAEVTYHPDNKYHNNIHAADVTQSLSVLLSFKVGRGQRPLFPPTAANICSISLA